MNSREIIHKFVNMARHPEAKDLKHALSLETRYLRCEYTVTDRDYTMQGIPYSDIADRIDTILGRPITAFDVCWALNKKHNPAYYFDLKLYNFNNDRLSQSIKISAHSSKNADKEGLIYFDMKKPDATDIFLTEWSDDTSDKITKLINL